MDGHRQEPEHERRLVPDQPLVAERESEKPKLDASREQRHGEKDEHGAEKTHGEVWRPTGAVARVARVVAGESIADASELEKHGRHEEKSEERMGLKSWTGSRDDLRGERQKENHRGVAGQTCVGLDPRIADRPARRAAAGPKTDRADQDDYGHQKNHRVHATRGALTSRTRVLGLDLPIVWLAGAFALRAAFAVRVGPGQPDDKREPSGEQADAEGEVARHAWASGIGRASMVAWSVTSGSTASVSTAWWKERARSSSCSTGFPRRHTPGGSRSRRSRIAFGWSLPRSGARALKDSLRRSGKPGTFSDADLDEYARAFSAAGAATGALNYYRAALRSRLPPTKITAPTMLIWAEDDFALGIELTRGMDDLFEITPRIEYLPDTSHWVMEERPEVVNRLLLEFLV